MVSNMLLCDEAKHHLPSYPKLHLLYGKRMKYIYIYISVNDNSVTCNTNVFDARVWVALVSNESSNISNCFVLFN